MHTQNQRRKKWNATSFPTALDSVIELFLVCHRLKNRLISGISWSGSDDADADADDANADADDANAEDDDESF